MKFMLLVVGRMVRRCYAHVEELLRQHFQPPKVLIVVSIYSDIGKVIKMIKTSKAYVIKSITSFLKYQRKSGYGYSQPNLAHETGLTQAQLSSYENGKSLPSLLAAIAIADCFDVSLDYLVGRCQNSKAHKTMKEFKYKED